ncbi:HEAT repeat domain-containing protein [Methanofollis sp.]|uniref:HEAT repeat domain-containing protein n=1 Tax=Methanofollis sp. TaxID=2052835 RepID=UPI00261932B4|nr:HEAT repeat domain-containing protein [Methanofollis sp.]
MADEMTDLILAISSQDLDERHEAEERLVAIGEDAVLPLIEVLIDGDAGARWYAGRVLARIGAPAIRPLILTMIVEQDTQFRRYAAAALGSMGETAVEPLIEAFSSEDRELRGFIALALCRIGEPARGPLKRLAGEGDEVQRSCARLTLWKMGEEGINDLVSSLDAGKAT